MPSSRWTLRRVGAHEVVLEAFPEEAITGIMDTCRGNVRTLEKLAHNIERVLEINGRDAASRAVVRKGRDQLLLGTD